MPQLGTYFDLVQNQKLPVAQALQQAFGMTAEDFQKAIRDYYQSLAPTTGAQGKIPQVSHFPAPFGPDDIAMVVKRVTDDDAHARVAEIMARQPEHRDQGLRDLQALAQEPNDNQLAHRALAYTYMQAKDFKQAGDELEQAADLDPEDRWVRFYFALLKFRKAQTTGQPIESLANVQQGLKTVIDWNPELAEAYHLLGLAELEGGGVHAAADSMRTAIQLNPRNERYVMNLAEIYIAGKNWDKAQDIMDHLKGSADAQLASEARKKLEDLPFIKKYGIPPERAADPERKEQLESAAHKSGERDKRDAESESEEDQPKKQGHRPDKRPVQHMKGRIVRVDCSQSPEATVTVASGARVLKFRTGNYKALVVIGADEFSCDWRNRPASVNYKAIGKSEGDLVSLEVR
jgi:tetratricopeptide (TPR) repeat protein